MYSSCNATRSYDSTQTQWGLGIYAFGLPYIIFSLWLFFYGKYSYRFERLKNRKSIVAIMVWSGALVQLNVNPLELWIGDEYYPCWVKALLSFAIVPLIGGAIFARLISYYFRNRFEREAVLVFKNEFEKNLEDDAADADQGSYRVRFRAIGLAIRETLFFATPKATQIDIHSLRFLQSQAGLFYYAGVVFYLPALVAFTVFMIISPKLHNGCSGCFKMPEASYFIIFQGVSTSLIALIALFRVKDVPDKWNVKTETLACIVCATPAILGYGLVTFGPLGWVGLWDLLLTGGVWGVLFSTIELQFIIAYFKEIPAMRDARKKSTVEAMRIVSHKQASVRASSGEPAGGKGSPKKELMSSSPSSRLATSSLANLVSLAAVLSDPEMSRSFEDHLLKEFGVESLFFYREIERFRLMFAEMRPSVRLVRAKQIVKLYVRPDGLYAVNFPSVIATNLIRTVEESNEIQKDIFDQAMLEVERLLQTGALLRFRLAMRKAADKKVGKGLDKRFFSASLQDLNV